MIASCGPTQQSLAIYQLASEITTSGFDGVLAFTQNKAYTFDLWPVPIAKEFTMSGTLACIDSGCNFSLQDSLLVAGGIVHSPASSEVWRRSELIRKAGLCAWNLFP